MTFIDPPERLKVKYINLYRAMSIGFITFFISFIPIIYFEESGNDSVLFGYFFFALMATLIVVVVANIIWNKILFRMDLLSIYPFNKNNNLIQKNKSQNKFLAWLPFVILLIIVLFVIIFRPF